MKNYRCECCGVFDRYAVFTYWLILGAERGKVQHQSGLMCSACRTVGRDCLRTDKPFTDEEAALIDGIIPPSQGSGAK